MHHFHDSIIRPLLDVLHPSTMMEIGIGDGAHTVKLLEYGQQSGAVLHAIDTLRPESLGAWQTRYGSTLIFQQGQSITVLKDAPTADIVFIDGDHNWYTVMQELRLIERRATESGTYPVIVLHDTAWPYARRDMYYNPDTVPAEFRQPLTRAGVVPGKAEMMPEGMNGMFFHAVTEGGQRNGVLTAVEDFLRLSTVHYNVVHIPGLHGLSILAANETVERNPALATFMHQLKLSSPVTRHIDATEAARLELQIHANKKQPIPPAPPEKPETPKPKPVSAPSELTRQIDHLQQERTRLLSELDRVLTSGSWRLMLPLRLARRVIRACRPKAVMQIVQRDLQILTGRSKSPALQRHAETAPVTVLLRTSDTIGGLQKTLESIQRQSVHPQRIVVFGPSEAEAGMRETCADEPTAEWGGPTTLGWMEQWLRKESRPYILPLQASDILHPEYIRHGLDALNAFPSAGIAYSDCHIRSSRHTIRTPASLPSPASDIWLHPACLVRRDALVQVCRNAGDDLQDLWRAIVETRWGAVKSRGMVYFRSDPRTPAPAHEPREATLLLALSGRAWMWPITAAFLERQTYPHDRMHVVLLDTSQNPVFGALVAEWMAKCDYASVTLQQLHAGRSGIADLPRESVAQEMSDTCATVYSALARTCKTPLACILEDDVIPPDDAFVRLAMNLWSTNAISVAGIYRHRLSPSLVAWTWSIDGEAVSAKMQEQGVSAVGGNGFGCVVMRGNLLRNTVFRSGEPTFNFDQNFYHELVFLRGQTALVDWDCRCKHYVDQNHWVVPL